MQVDHFVLILLLSDRSMVISLFLSISGLRGVDHADRCESRRVSGSNLTYLIPLQSSPIFENLSDKTEEVEFYKVDVDDQPEISQEVGIRAVSKVIPGLMCTR